MRTRTAVALACAAILGTTPASAWSGPQPARRPIGEVAHRSDVAVELAARALRGHAHELGVDARSFRFETVRHSLIGTHVRGQEYRGGIPVDGTWAVVHLLAEGRVDVAAQGASGLPGAPTAAPLSEATATARALGALHSSTPHIRARRVLVRHGERLVDVWRVAVVSAQPSFAGYIDVDAATGVVGRPIDNAHRADGTATVFDPNPVVTLRSHALRQPYTPDGIPDVDLDSAELTAARRTLPLREVDTAAMAQSRLAGPYVNVLMPGLLPLGSVDFDVTRSDPKFEGLMAYAHLDGLQRYLQSLGFSGTKAINAEPQDVLATRLEQFDNSLYSQDLDLLVFGTGGVDDAEDAEIVVHEYGHALQDAQVPGWPASGQIGAMGEGFGDVLAAAYFARSARPRLRRRLHLRLGLDVADRRPGAAVCTPTRQRDALHGRLDGRRARRRRDLGLDALAGPRPPRAVRGRAVGQPASAGADVASAHDADRQLRGRCRGAAAYGARSRAQQLGDDRRRGSPTLRLRPVSTPRRRTGRRRHSPRRTSFLMSMKPRVISGLLAAAVVSSALPAFAARPSATPIRIEYAGHGVVRGDLGRADGAPVDVARRALTAQAPRLGVRAADFRFESVRTSVIGTHIRGREYRGGVPVDRSAVAVHLIDGRVTQVEARGLARLAGGPSSSPIPEKAARAAALGAAGVTSPLKATARRVLVERGGRLVDTWQVSIVSLTPAYAGRVDVDAGTGRLLGRVDDSRYVDGTAKVFDPNPIVSERNSGLRQPVETGQSVDLDLDEAKLTAARKTLPLKELDATALQTGRLSGPWVNVIALGYASIGAPAFDIPRGDPRFEGLMAYAHLDRIQRYFQSLGYTGAKGVNAESQEVIATRVEGYDNSFYQPGNDLMLLGTGGVDDGEDAEVIVHEYGHAVQDAQVAGWGATNEGGAMGEGFGDFLAASYYARSISKGFQDECLMDWDSTSYSDADPACIRRTDSKKKYPDDIAGEVHDDGEIWCAYLWRVRQRIGRTAAQRSDNSIKLVLASHELLTPQAEFGDAVAALRGAAKALRHADWVKAIDAEARRTGLPLNP